MQRRVFKPDCMVRQPRAVQEQKQRVNEARRTDEGRALYKTAAWLRLRQVVLREQPFCVVCLKAHRHVTAAVVDHVLPHRGDHALFFERRNLQALCKRHHDQKTAREDGGFGRARRS